jgi:uncharacterized membrane protein
LRIRLGDGLIPINILALLLIAATMLSQSNFLSVILGLPFVLFFPGYSLVLALFPRKESISNIERIVLSLGLSFSVVPLIGLMLNYSPWGVRIESVFTALYGFLVIISTIAFLRRRKVEDSERIHIRFTLKMPGWGASPLDRALSIILAVSIIGVLGMSSYSVFAHKTGQRFTEFYVPPRNGQSVSSAENVSSGKESSVLLGISNHEYETVNYRIEASMDGSAVGSMTGIVLAHGEKWEGEIKFVPEKAGQGQRLDLLLFKNEEITTNLELHLMINAGN